jgi:non-ribosomal peptide synthase protein (TIGR01720 family)
MLHGSVSISEANVSLGYWSSICTDEQAANIASTFTKILHYVLEGHEFLAELNLLSGSDKKQKLEWNSLRHKTLDACVHNVVTQQITPRADSPSVKGWDASFKNQEIDEETHQRSIGAETEESKELITTMHQRLQSILTKVLNLPEERIILNRSFLSLGGDSITAMQFVAQARKEGIVIRVQDVLQNQNILGLASVAKTKSGQQTSPLEEYELDTTFDVSPIQQMYFNLGGQVANQPNHHFNQSFLLRLVKEFPGSDLTRVIEAVVRQHLMLRARFRQVKDGQWVQFISSDISGSYRFDIHDITDQAEMMASLVVIQASLNIEKGPVFAGAAFNIAGSGQVLFLVAHHLVIDLVSWRVILQDIEELLDSGVPSAVVPLSFQKWCRLQKEHAQQHLLPEKVLPFAVVPADNVYWGMANQANVYGDVVSESFVIDVETTAILLENCNTALGTESVEIFLATMIHSFNQIFADRPVPTIFNEGHGREPWDSDIDLSRTVGWFTTITPLHVPVLAGMNLIDVIRRTKDIRRKLPGNGLPYFASRFLTAEGADAFGDHLSIEILFNYLGRYQQLERDDGLLRQEPRPAGTAVSDVGSDVQRLALLEISAVIMHGSVHFQCVYNRKMQRQPDIICWMRAWEESLREAVRILPRMNVERTLSDFPLLPTSVDQETFQGLLTAINSRLPGQTTNAIEGISTCTNLQSMMLESMDDCSIEYRVSDIFKVEDVRGNVNLDRLKQAWSSVLTSHAALRTIFAKYSFKGRTQFLQVVLKAHVPRINTLDAQSGDQALKLLKNIQPFRLMPFNEGPPYQLTIVQCRGRGAVWVRFDIFHAILDATSLQIIKRDVCNLYNLDSEPQPLLGSSFLPFVKANLPCETSDALHYWTKYLEGSRPTIVRPLQHSAVGAQQSVRSLSSHSSISICVANLPLLRASCRFYNATVSNLVNAAWSIVLHHTLMGQQDICFGYLVSARDVTLIPNVESAVGPHLNLLLQRVPINGNTTLITVLLDIARHSAAHLTHQGRGSDAEYLPRNGKQTLFNTLVNYRKVLIPRVTNESGSSLKQQKSNLSMEVIESSDPWNVSLFLTPKPPDSRRTQISSWH